MVVRFLGPVLCLLMALFIGGCQSTGAASIQQEDIEALLREKAGLDERSARMAATLIQPPSAGGTEASSGSNVPPGARLPGTPINSQVPVPNAYPLSTQQKMQAIHHWEVLAEDSAGIFANQMRERFPEQQESIYVAPGGITPFAKAFRELLITKLVENGMAVSNNHKEPLVLAFETQLVKHSRRIIQTRSGEYRALAPGFFVRRDTPLSGFNNRIGETEFLVAASEVSVEAGEYTIHLPSTELMVTLSLMLKGNFIMRRSSVYYISDPEWWHYGQKAEVRDPAVRQYTLVNQ